MKRNINAADEYKALVRESWSEQQFTDAVLALAKRCGWRAIHLRPARTALGWRTAVQGDGKGFTDVLALRDHVLLVAELKVKNRKPTPEQEAWLDAFRQVPLSRVFLWTPKDWDAIEVALA